MNGLIDKNSAMNDSKGKVIDASQKGNEQGLGEKGTN